MRDDIVKKTDRYFWFNFFWAFAVGGFVYYVCAYGNDGILDSRGSPNDMWGIGCTLIYSLVAAHNALFAIEIRAYSAVLVFALCLSFITFMPLTIMMNDGLSIQRGGPYFRNQWVDVFNHPKIHLVVFLNAFVIVLPRFIWRVVENVVLYPEYSRVKSA